MRLRDGHLVRIPHRDDDYREEARHFIFTVMITFYNQCDFHGKITSAIMVSDIFLYEIKLYFSKK